jgi:hypothetical protein
MHVISYGGGVQSTALVVLAATGTIDPARAALFANVGDDSENPDTLTFIRDVMIPWAAKRNVKVIELRRSTKRGAAPTLWTHLHRRGSRSIDIPIRMANGAPGRRQCTLTYKIRVIERWLRDNGATATSPADVAVGFSTDEAHRASNRVASDIQRPHYPLLELGMDREKCKATIRAAGLPVPPKSACFFCPFHRPRQWADMARDAPELFSKSVMLEKKLNTRRGEIGKDPVYLTRFGRPLDEAICTKQQALELSDVPDTDTCDDGFCWT